MSAPSELAGELPPTLHRFFPLSSNTDETDADICRDITLLSTLLRNYRPGKSTVLQAKQAGGSAGSETDLWSHVSYALASGSSTDIHGSKVVVGRIEPGSIAATVIARNTSRPAGHSPREAPIEVDEVVLLRDRVVKQMLKSPTTLL